MTDSRLPDALHEALERDSQAVTPLSPVWQRTLWALAAAAAALLLSVVVIGVRSDMDEIPFWLSWGCSVMELVLAAALLGLGLRESIPGRAVTTMETWSALTVAVLYQIGVGFVTYRFSPGLDYGIEPLAHGIGCAKQDLLTALPTLVVIALLIMRATPVRAPNAGLLAGAGAAIATDAVTHLRCPVSDMRHVLLWHTGAVLILAAAGWGAGLLWQRFRRPR